jgi:diguanylate cyclase (GGDEF)-like protein
MFPQEAATLQPLELLELLRGYTFLEDFTLALYYERDGRVSRLGSSSPLCGLLAGSLVCSDKCEAAYESAVKSALDKRAPMLFSCRAGLLNFAVPYLVRDGLRYCFVAGGVRKPSIDLFLTEKLAKSDRINGFALLERLEALPTASADEVKHAAKEVSRLLGSLDPDGIQARLLASTVDKFAIIREILSQADRVATLDALFGLLGETLGILFDVPKAAVGLVAARGAVRLRGMVGLPEALGSLSIPQLTELFPGADNGPVTLTKREMAELFPVVAAERAVCLPVSGADGVSGLLALFDSELQRRDELLLGMVTDRMAAKISQFAAEETHRLESDLAGKFMAVLGTISATDNRRDLYQSILETAADLLQVSSGSLMLVDDSGKNLRIESVLGMNLQLARSMSARVGRGIAGKVAQTGEPLLVRDIEQDARVRIANRSRFKTKSFLSVPLTVQGKVIGVLNLSDKKNGETFAETDLDVIMTMARQACVALERAESSERAAQLEELTVTDPLTGLFNRRFLQQRLEEELSRSGRQRQSLTILMADLDYFKVYNDLCGHAAGDVVLKKAARLLKASARQMDVVTRFGGERFCIILPATSKQESFCVAERFRREVERAGFAHEENLPLGRLTVSIGIATAPENGGDVSALLGAADVALHRAKMAGRNRVAHFDAAGLSEVKTAPAIARQQTEVKASV